MILIEDRARDVLSDELTELDEPFEIVPGRLGDSDGHAYGVQIDNARSLVVPSQGESRPALISMDKRDGIVAVQLWPDEGVSYYVECTVNADASYALNWGAKMSDDPAVKSQGTRITVEDQTVYYFATPPAAANSTGSVRFWFQMQDGTEGSWNLLRIGVVPFRRN